MCSQVVQIHYLSLMNTLSDSLIFSRQSCNFTKGFNIDSLSQLVFWWSVKGRKQTFLQTKTDRIFWPQKLKVGSKDLIKSIKKKNYVSESPYFLCPRMYFFFTLSTQFTNFIQITSHAFWCFVSSSSPDSSWRIYWKGFHLIDLYDTLNICYWKH